MEQKTKVIAEEYKQEILITREFDLPLELLFRAYVEPAIVEQWMSTKVVKLERRWHESFRFETTGSDRSKFGFSGVIHEFIVNGKIIRTFEMKNSTFGVQLEILEFYKLVDNRSRLSKKVVYESVSCRDENLKLPFAYGINRAHYRLQDIALQSS